jgi:hypothetical protein
LKLTSVEVGMNRVFCGRCAVGLAMVRQGVTYGVAYLAASGLSLRTTSQRASKARRGSCKCSVSEVAVDAAQLGARAG